MAHSATVPGLWVRGLLDACGGSLGKPLGSLLEAVLRPLGASWGPFGGLLGLLLSLLGASWGVLWASWGYVGRLGCHLGGKGSKCRFVFPLWGPSWRRLGALLGRLGGLLGRLEPKKVANMVPTWFPKRYPNRKKSKPKSTKNRMPLGVGLLKGFGRFESKMEPSWQ